MPNRTLSINATRRAQLQNVADRLGISAASLVEDWIAEIYREELAGEPCTEIEAILAEVDGLAPPGWPVSAFVDDSNVAMVGVAVPGDITPIYTSPGQARSFAEAVETIAREGSAIDLFCDKSVQPATSRWVVVSRHGRGLIVTLNTGSDYDEPDASTRSSLALRLAPEWAAAIRRAAEAADMMRDGEREANE